MNLIKKIQAITATGIISLSSAKAGAYLYEDFSSAPLDTQRWTETHASNLTDRLSDEHFVADGVYHTAQLTEADGGTDLILNQKFLSGDVLDYDVNYISGEGNRIHTIDINGNKTSWALFGFWNTLSDGGVGNELGKYHVNLRFTSEGVIPLITLPNGSKTNVVGNILGAPSQEYSFGIVTRTGHNGTVHMDYDNVYINGIPEPSTLALLGLGGAIALKRRK